MESKTNIVFLSQRSENCIKELVCLTLYFYFELSIREKYKQWKSDSNFNKMCLKLQIIPTIEVVLFEI